MKIPDGPSGMPTLSASQFRTYGTGGFEVDDQEPTKGCPRFYFKRYVARDLPEEAVPDMLRYGSFFHDVLFGMEEHGYTPDEALRAAFEPDMPASFWTEAREDLDRYLERGATPTDRFATLDVEIQLEALLYVDEDFGPIYFRGFLDWLGADIDFPGVFHLVDYKTNRQPPKYDDLKGDVQLRGYHWLVAQNAEKYGQKNPRIVSHLDAVKFRDVEIAYTDEDIADWHSWAEAVARKILRDEKHEPILNAGCAWCPARIGCPAFEAMPQGATNLLAQGFTTEAGLRTFADPVARIAWRDEANKMRLLLEKAVKGVDDTIKAEVAQSKTKAITIGDAEWVLEGNFKDIVDVRMLHTAMGDDEFYKVVSTSKTAVEAAVKTWEPSRLAKVREAITRQIEGSKVVRKKVKR